MTYDKQQLIEHLQRNLYSERTAIRIYDFQAKRVSDPDIGLVLRSIANTEAHHAMMLTEAIKGLEAKPKTGVPYEDTQILALIREMETDEDLLRLNIVLENMAANDYRQDAMACPYPEISETLKEIMSDEEGHSQRFLDILYKLKGDTKEEDALSVFTTAMEKGKKRLARPWLEMFMSGVIGAIHVTFGTVAMAAGAGAVESRMGSHGAILVGSVFFPIGFILLKLSQSELFTENFLVPVIPVFDKKSPPQLLAKLWSLTLLGNLLGALIFSGVVYLGGKTVLGALPVHHLLFLAQYKLSRPFIETLMSAVLAGAIITTMTWLVLATKSDVAKLMAIWSCIFVMAVGSFTHVVVSTSEVLLGGVYGAHITLNAWFLKLFIPASLGNLLGGMLLIALLHYLQVLHARRKQEAYMKRKEAALERAIKEKLRL
jgi:formate/nitrite transporter FocA (FNT family)/bacterioferritin (cytochrome b1)